MDSELTVIGGGLAGSEAAWQAAQRGLRVTLYEMRPVRNTPAHVTDRLAELVCSNSLGARSLDRALGLLKEEMKRLGSLVVVCAEAAAVPAGGALAVDRVAFAEAVTARVTGHPNITLRRQEVTRLPDGPTIIASGPLTSDALAAEIVALTGQDRLAFFDAIAPIVEANSINMNVAFQASRYERGEQDEGDYLNCPMTEDEYRAFVEALLAAETIPLRDFESRDKRFFEACLPVEVLGARGGEALAFGPLRPVGLIDPHTGRRPYAVVQLRQDNLAATLYNMVGFQTNLRWGEQRRVFRMIPGLENAEFLRYGQMHRNTFINSPALLDAALRLQLPPARAAQPGRATSNFQPPTWFAGQITGTEGYVGSAMSGLVAGLNAARTLRGQPPLAFPPPTMIGALLHYISHAEPRDFQPMKANFGLLPPLEKRVRRKAERYQAYASRALADLQTIVDLLK
jgi:methylenetetrahydrofolate--tRNA-(uracil-5-)-methyltransferase